MKSKLLALALAMSASFSAFAAPAIALPPGPLYLKFSGNEQIGLVNPTTGVQQTTYSDATHSGEINWGVFIMKTMDVGTVTTPNLLIGDGSTFFTNMILPANSQITGMFYDVKPGVVDSSNPFPATGGFLDLYWRDTTALGTETKNATSGPGIRCGYSCATDYTDGVLLAHLSFASGYDTVDPTNFISGSVIPTVSVNGFSGIANSFAEVDAAAGGLWASQLNSDWFITTEGTRDIRFKNSYDSNTAWNSTSNPFIVGAALADPAQAFALPLPEPGALSLMGLALVGMGAIRRRKQK